MKIKDFKQGQTFYSVLLSTWVDPETHDTGTWARVERCFVIKRRNDWVMTRSWPADEANLKQYAGSKYAVQGVMTSTHNSVEGYRYTRNKNKALRWAKDHNETNGQGS